MSKFKVGDKEIHITVKGNTTHAVLKENGKVTKRAQAVCSPEDSFDFKTGAEIAFNRLFESPVESKVSEEFWDKWKTEKIVVNCQTEQEAKAFLVEADKRGFKWNSGNFLLNHPCWHVYKDKTCYCHDYNGVCYANTDFYKSHGCTIIYYSDLAQGKLPHKEEFKPYMFTFFIGKKNGEIGASTPFSDVVGRPLEVGDTVEVFDGNEFKEERSICQDEDCFFVMGLKGHKFKNGISDNWKIIKKRSHTEIKDGEEVDVIVYRKKP